MHRTIVATALALAACSSGDGSDGYSGPTAAENPTNPGVNNPFDIPDTGDTDASGDTLAADSDEPVDTDPPLKTIDCADLPEAPFPSRVVPGAKGYHGLAFDTQGFLYGNSDGVLYKVDQSGNTQIHATGLGTLEQIDELPNGDFVAASKNNANIYRIAANGSVLPFGSISGVYGVRVGPDGMVYTANESRMHRIDPATGDTEVFLPPMDGFNPKVFDWNLDYTQMYIGTNYSDGKVWVVDLDASYDPVGQPEVMIPSVGASWHDGLGVDICGNIYVAEFWTSALYKIDAATLQVEQLFSNSAMYGHGIEWGPGVGGWADDNIYLPQPYNGDTVAEVTIGVPYRTYPGPVINRP